MLIDECPLHRRPKPDENGEMYSEEGTLTLDWMTSSRGAGLGTVL